MPNQELVRDIMMTHFKQIDGLTKISDALKMMKANKIHAVLIEPRNKADVHGILTLRDIARKVIAEKRKLGEVHAYEIMSKPVLSVQASMPIPYAARLLTNFKVSYGMVVENDATIGLVSLNGMVELWDFD